MARKRGESWQGSLKIPQGKYHRYSFPTKDLAEAWEARAREALSAGEDIPDASTVMSDRPTLRSFFRDHQGSIWGDTLPRNAESNQRACEAVLGQDTNLDDITVKVLTEFVAVLKKKGNRPSTINTRLSHLKVLLRYAKALELVGTELEFPWVPKGDNTRKRYLTEDEEEMLLGFFQKSGQDHMHRLVTALIDTGCRPSELIYGESTTEPIRWSEVSKLAGGTAPDVLDPATGRMQAIIHLKRTKTGKARTLPLTDRARNAFLQSKREGDDRPFGRMRSDDASMWFRHAAQQVGLHDGTRNDEVNVVLYTCRHTCASRLMQRSGGDVARVMKWMGHTKVTTTMGYSHLAPNDIFNLGELL